VDGIYFRGSVRLFHVADGKFHEVRWLGLHQLVPASNGLFGAEDHGTVTLRTIAGDVRASPGRASLGRGQLDDGGRIWSLITGQLEVADAATLDVTVVPMGSYAALDRIESDTDLVVLGAGPALPAPRPVRHTKAIVGTIVSAGEPLANVPVELCARSFLSYTRSRACYRRVLHNYQPCTGSDRRIAETRTNGAGAFAVENAPMGTIYLHYKLPEPEGWEPDGWSNDSPALRLLENGISDQGTIDLAPKK
jgi:hypothetical protein